MYYAKAVVAGVYGVAVALTAALADNVLGIDEWGAIASALAIAVAGVINVAKVENKG